MSEDHIKPPTQLNLTGNVSNNWKTFKQQFELYMIATEKCEKPEKVKCALFLTIIGDAALEVYNTFTFMESEQNKLQAILEKFETYCNPRKNITYERHIFNTRRQGTQETVDQYITELKRLAHTCEFSTLKDSLIKDRVVCGINDDQVRERLLREQDLTLDRAMEICRAAEISKKQIKALTEEGEEQICKVQGKSNTKRSKCSRCNTSHIPRQCPAYGHKCQNCGIMNHFQVCCRNRIQTNQNKQRGINTIEKEREVESKKEEESYFIGQVQQEETEESWYVILNMKNQKVKFLIDTGAKINVLPITQYEKLESTEKIQHTTVKLTSYAGHRIPILGKVTIPCTYKQTRYNIEFFVTGERKAQAIIGIDTSVKLNLIQRINQAETKEGETEYKQLINEYTELFEGVGEVPHEYNIKLSSSIQPVINAPRRVPEKIREPLKEELDRMVKDNIIEEVTEPTDWVNPIIIIRKPNGRLRICLDPTELNKAIKREHYLMPTLEEITARIEGAQVWSVLDAKSGFWQIPLTKESAIYTTFATPFGRYKFLRLPFGISSAPEVFQRTMKIILTGIPNVETFADDILVWAKNHKEHKETLKLVLEALKRNNLKLNKEKCEIGKQTEIKYLGHVLTKEGLKADPQKTKAILQMPRPEDKKAVLRFLGMLTYLAKFIPKLSIEAEPLRKLIVKDQEWQWKEEQQECWEKLKTLASTPPILQYYNNKKSLQLQVDASKSGLGACLMQDGRPVAYSSRAMTKAEKNYSQIEKEALAVVFGMERFHYYVYAQEVEIWSDHKPLETILNKSMQQAPPRLQRLKMRLMKYQYKVIYRKGKNMEVADTLSRAYLEQAKDKQQGEQHDILVVKTEIEKEIQEYEKLSEIMFHIKDQKLEKVRKHTQEDKQMQLLKTYISEGWPKKNMEWTTVAAYHKIKDELSTMDNIILKGERLIIPKAMRAEVLEDLHQGHWGIEKTKRRAREGIYWPQMNQDIEQMIEKCSTCEKHLKQNAKESLHSHEIPILPWQNVAADLFHWNGQEYILVVDHYSNFIEIGKLENATAETVIRNLKSIFARHGSPVTCYTDNGPQFNNSKFKEFENRWKFKHITSSPEYPQSNGLAERGVQSVKKMLQKCLEDKTDPYLGLLTHRNTPIKGIATPAQLLMGRRLRTTIPEAYQGLKPKTIQPEIIEKGLQKAKEMQAKYYNKDTKELAILPTGLRVGFKSNKRFHWGEIIKKMKEPRSYQIKGDNGLIYRRNRRQITTRESIVKKHAENEIEAKTTEGTSSQTTNKQKQQQTEEVKNNIKENQDSSKKEQEKETMPNNDENERRETSNEEQGGETAVKVNDREEERVVTSRYGRQIKKDQKD